MSSLGFNQDIVNRFKQLQTAAKLGHAYLLIGPAYSGKKQTCLQIAQFLNCLEPNTPCGNCPSCRKIAAGSHPDIVLLKPLEDKTSISIDQMRYVIGRLGLSAYEGKTKVVIIPEVEKLTTEATNAFLKTLEEPTKNTILLLTTVNLAMVLDTIKSRCQWIRMQPQRSNEIRSLLIKEGLDEAQATWLAKASGGFGQLALNMSSRETIMQRQGLVKSFLSLETDDDTIKALTEDKEALQETILVLMSFLADVLATKSLKALSVSWNEDLASYVQEYAKRNMNEIIAIYKQLIIISRQIQENLNVKMSLMVLKEQLCQPLSK